MSTCPELELLSVYLDEELPRQYEQKLKDHLASCTECKVHYENLKSLHENLQLDAKNITPSERDLDEGFLRLKTKMNYKSVIKPSFNFPSVAKWAFPFVAVAAIMVAVILPTRFSNRIEYTDFVPKFTQFATPVKMIQETGVARDATLYSTKTVSNEQNFTTATIDIVRPELSETIRININLSGLYNFNSQTPYEDVILPASFAVDVEK